jgi:BlaI family transcriptional regulator, penicillinase repressor
MNNAMKISEAEWLVCQILWRQSPLTALEIISRLEGKTGWNPSTIKSLINRLVKKNVLGFEIQGREYLYSPRIGEEECIQAHTQSFVQRVWGGASGAMMVSFLKHQKLSPGDIDELRALLKEKRGRK